MPLWRISKAEDGAFKSILTPPKPEGDPHPEGKLVPGSPHPGWPIPGPPGSPHPGRPSPGPPGSPHPGRPIPGPPGNPHPGRPTPGPPGRPHPGPLGSPHPGTPGNPIPGPSGSGLAAGAATARPIVKTVTANNKANFAISISGYSSLALNCTSLCFSRAYIQLFFMTMKFVRSEKGVNSPIK